MPVAAPACQALFHKNFQDSRKLGDGLAAFDHRMYRLIDGIPSYLPGWKVEKAGNFDLSWWLDEQGEEVEGQLGDFGRHADRYFQALHQFCSLNPS